MNDKLGIFFTGSFIVCAVIASFLVHLVLGFVVASTLSLLLAKCFFETSKKTKEDPKQTKLPL